MAQKNILTITALAAALALVGCGGGGSKGYFDTGSGGSNGGEVAAQVQISPLGLFDINNDTTTTVSTEGATAKVTVRDGKGQPVSGALVNFAGENVVFGTSNGSVLTNADGVATIFIKPADTSTTGAYQLSASVSHHGATATSEPYNFTFQDNAVSFSAITVADRVVASGDTTTLSLKVVDQKTQTAKNNIAVSFTTTCGTFDQDSILSVNEGDVSVRYKAIDVNGNLCQGSQTVTAMTSDAGVKQSVSVNVAAIVPNSIIYSSEGVNLATTTSGSAASSQVEFTIFQNGKPVANQDVQVDLVRGPTDFSFNTLNNRDVQVFRSDATGKISVTVYPGAIPGPVELKATLVSNANVFALSRDLSIATGRVTQSGLSLSVSKNSLRTQLDGDVATIVARMVDRVGNVVPDGTVISFVAEGGKVGRNCATVNGSCSVELSTQNPRPVDNRVTVLAYVEGEKAYTDVNGDNLYTAGTDRLISNIGDFFRDDNENNKYDAGEFIYKRGGVGATCAASTISQPNIAGTCDTGLEAVLRDQMLFAFAYDTPSIPNARISRTSLSFNLFGNDSLSVPMPSGAGVSVATTDNTKDNDLACSAEHLRGSETVQSVFDLMTPTTFVDSTQTFYEYTLKECAPGDTVTLSVTSGGKVTKVPYTIP